MAAKCDKSVAVAYPEVNQLGIETKELDQVPLEMYTNRCMSIARPSERGKTEILVLRSTPVGPIPAGDDRSLR